MNKYLKLGLSLLLDGIGMVSYLIPGFGEGIDIAWGPISFVIMTQMYKGSTGKIAGIVSALEEMVPATDVIPTFTLTWLYVYVGKKDTIQDAQVIEVEEA